MTKRILVIDDEPDIREVTQIALEETAGWTTLAASSGAEGLAAAAALPDAILLDIMMPDMDGFTVLAKLKADPRTAEIPVILLTAKVQSVHGKLRAQGAGVILKPFDPMTLATEIAHLLGWPQTAAAQGT